MEDSICKNFAKKLKEIREKQGLSKGQLSSLADCDISYIGKIERSEKYPNLKMIAKLAVALKVPAKDLFDFEWYIFILCIFGKITSFYYADLI